MRYTTFRNLALVAGAAVFAGGGYWCGRSSTPPVQVVAPSPAPAVAQPAQPAQPTPPARPPVPVDNYQSYLIGLLGRPASSDKIKDGLHGPIKVNVYAANGVWKRAKVDLDRDEKWDEKWSLEGTAIMRQVAPADDERYGEKTQVGSTAGQ
jgi:hypothetical protein